jgi:hypothetical protein
VAGSDLLEQLVRDRDESGTSFHRLLLESERVVGLGEAILVRGAAQALKVVDIVYDRNPAVDGRERRHRQGVGKVVAVDHVRPERVQNLAELRRWLRIELHPAVEELVARAVPLAERPASVREAELEVRSSRAEPDRVLECADARLLLDEENAFHFFSV